MALSFKKDHNTDHKNYRLISLLSQVYKLLKKLPRNTFTIKLDEYQSMEQTTFSRISSEHLHILRTLLEKSLDCKLELSMAFVNFRKAFAGVEHLAFQNSLENARVGYTYVQLLKYMEDNVASRMSAFQHEKTDRIEKKIVHVSTWKTTNKLIVKIF